VARENEDRAPQGIGGRARQLLRRLRDGGVQVALSVAALLLLGLLLLLLRRRTAVTGNAL
jgi:hypothetical protein